MDSRRNRRSGLSEAARCARSWKPDAVVCDFDVLIAGPLDEWEQDHTLAGLPLVAVSLTRRANEMSAYRTDGVAGVLYLPTLNPAKMLDAGS